MSEADDFAALLPEAPVPVVDPVMQATRARAEELLLLGHDPEQGLDPAEVMGPDDVKLCSDFLAYMQRETPPGQKLKGSTLLNDTRKMKLDLPATDPSMLKPKPKPRIHYISGYGIGTVSPRELTGIDRIPDHAHTLFLCEDGLLRLYGTNVADPSVNNVTDVPDGSTISIGDFHKYAASDVPFREKSLQEVLVEHATKITKP